MFGGTSRSGAAARRERNRQEMRDAILKTARQIVASGGADELTIRSVAQQLGYSPGALYEYFTSKEEILKALYFESQDGLGTAFEQTVRTLPAGASAIDALIALGHAYRQHALANAELFRMALGEFKTLPAPPAGAPNEKHGGFHVLLAVIEQGIAEGVFIDQSPLAVACAAWSSVHGFVSLELSGLITGGDRPGFPPPSPEAGKERRDQLFSVLERVILSGIVREEYRQQDG